MTQCALEASSELEKEGMDVEVIDLRTIKPIDEIAIIQSVEKTGRLIVVDGGWRTCGVGSEIASIVMEKAFHKINDPVIRITLPDTPAPASSILEKTYYPNSGNIVLAVKKLLGNIQ